MLAEDPGMGTQRGWRNPGAGKDTQKEKILPRLVNGDPTQAPVPVASIYTAALWILFRSCKEQGRLGCCLPAESSAIAAPEPLESCLLLSPWDSAGGGDFCVCFAPNLWDRLTIKICGGGEGQLSITAGTSQFSENNPTTMLISRSLKTLRLIKINRKLV